MTTWIPRLRRRGVRGARSGVRRPRVPRRFAARAQRRRPRHRARVLLVGQRRRRVDRRGAGLAAAGGRGRGAGARRLLRRPGAVRRVRRAGREDGPRGDRLGGHRHLRRGPGAARAVAGVPRRPVPAAARGEGAGAQRDSSPGVLGRAAPGGAVPPGVRRGAAQALAGRRGPGRTSGARG